MSEILTPWTTVQLGLHKTTRDYLKAIEGTSNLNCTFKDICDADGFIVAKRKTPVVLVRVTPKDLGFHSPPAFAEVCVAAKRRGLKLCKHEVAPALRLAMLEVGFGSGLVVMTEPVRDRYGPYTFMLLHKTLTMMLGYSEHRIDLGEELVFTLPKKKLILH